jgi:hypothetical protein
MIFLRKLDHGKPEIFKLNRFGDKTVRNFVSFSVAMLLVPGNDTSMNYAA